MSGAIQLACCCDGDPPTPDCQDCPDWAVPDTCCQSIWVSWAGELLLGAGCLPFQPDFHYKVSLLAPLEFVYEAPASGLVGFWRLGPNNDPAQILINHFFDNEDHFLVTPPFHLFQGESSSRIQLACRELCSPNLPCPVIQPGPLNLAGWDVGLNIGSNVDGTIIRIHGFMHIPGLECGPVCPPLDIVFETGTYIDTRPFGGQWNTHCEASGSEPTNPALTGNCGGTPEFCYVRFEPCPFTVDNEPDCLACCMDCDPLTNPNLDPWPYIECFELQQDGSDFVIKLGNCCLRANTAMPTVPEIPGDGFLWLGGPEFDTCIGPDSDDIDSCCEVPAPGPCELCESCVQTYTAQVWNIALDDDCTFEIDGVFCCSPNGASSPITRQTDPCRWVRAAGTPDPPGQPWLTSCTVWCENDPDTGVGIWTAKLQLMTRNDGWAGPGTCGGTCAFINLKGVRINDNGCPTGEYILIADPDEPNPWMTPDDDCDAFVELLPNVPWILEVT